MTKKSNTFMWVCFCGIGLYLVHCILLASNDRLKSPLWDYFGIGYASVYGFILVASLLGLIALVVTKRIRKRKTTGLKPISNGYKISFVLSYIPYLLLIIYSINCSIHGFTFFTTSYGWEGFTNAFVLMGLVFCIIPVLPFCFFWQILYIVKWIRNRKVQREQV